MLRSRASHVQNLCCRSISSYASLKEEIKLPLRELFKKIHPDLFVGSPKAQQANETSFKLLQEYLHVAQGKEVYAPSKPYAFEFYLRYERANGERANLRQVAVSLPCPNRLLPHEVFRSIRQLMAACDIPVAIPKHESHLLHFLPRAVEAYHQVRSRERMTSYNEFHLLRSALSLHHRICIMFEGNAALSEKVKLLRQLVELIGTVPVCLSGLRIGLGPSFGTDSRGTVWLHKNMSPTAWKNFLTEVDVHWCLDRAKHIEAEQISQRRAAAVLRAASIQAETAVSLTREYHGFLAMIENMEEHLLASVPRIDNVGLLVVSQSPREYVDTNGMLTVPSSSNLPGLLRLLQRHGHEAMRRATEKARVESEIRSLQKQVEITLRLKQLSRCPDLPQDRYKIACLRLLRHAKMLSALEGISVRIGSQTCCEPNNSPHIDIAWDFTL